MSMTRRTLAATALTVAVLTGAAGATQRPAQAPPQPAPKPRTRCVDPQSTPSPSSATPSAPLLGALGVLRRPRTPDDALPANSLRFMFADGVMTDAVRRSRSGLWLVPVTDLERKPPAACLRGLPESERRRILDAPPVEGVLLTHEAAPTGRYATDTITKGRAFSIQACTGEMHDRITVEGIVPDGASPVTLTTRDGSIVQATPEQNTVRFDLARPDSPQGLPAHITSGTLEHAIDPLLTRHLDKPCEPPTRNSIGKRREPPTALDRPAGARIELETTRWQPEDTGPRVAGAVYRREGRRCLLIAPERDLRAGKHDHRFCVDEDRLRTQRFIARATRVNGYVVLEGFVDRSTVSAIVVERSIRPGAHRLATTRGSGAFFMAIRGTFARGGAFQIHAALRGKPIRYTGLRDVKLRPR
jgi:hypothetical protein